MNLEEIKKQSANLEFDCGVSGDVGMIITALAEAVEEQGKRIEAIEKRLAKKARK